MIECTFRRIPEYDLTSYDGRLKEGRYHNSHFTIEKDKYIVAAYIDFDFKKWIGSNLKEEEIINQCIDFLNILVENKRKKKSYYKYGHLKSFNCKIKRENDNKFCIVALLETDDPDNKYFWGDPPNKRHIAPIQKRGRPKKNR